jgi:hypothetical protein
MTNGNLSWAKSSYSGSQGGNCVETAADSPNRVLVRDTMNRAGTVLAFHAHSWRQFTGALKEEKALP